MRRLRVLASLSLVFACAPAEEPRAFALRIATPGDLGPFQSRATSGAVAVAVDLVYQPMLRVGEQGKLLPGAVRAWERLAADRIRVQVDPALRFADGSPVRGDDVAASLTASGLDVRTGGEWLEIGPGSSRSPLEVTLLATNLSKDAAPAPLGTGPFRFVEGDARHIVLERVRPEAGRIARVEIRAAPTPRDAFAWALRGDVNAVIGLDDRQSELLEGVPGLRVVRAESPHAVAVAMNAGRLSREERLGLAAALSRPDLARVYGGGCVPLGDAVPGQTVPPGRPLEAAASSHDPGLPRVAMSLRRVLGTRGGDVAVESASRTLARLEARDFDLFVMGVVAWPPVVLGWFARTGAGANWTGYSNRRVDEAFDRGDLDAARAEMERDPPFVLVCRRQRIAAVDARIKNPTLGTWSLLETLPDWEVSQ